MYKHVSIVGTVGIPANYGGLETCAEQLVHHKSSRIKYTVYCSKKSYVNRVMNYNSDRLIYLPLKANGWQSIFYDYLSILHAILHSDTILVLGVSGCTIIPIIKIFIKRKFIINIDGLEWKRDKWNFISKFILKVSEIFAIKFADIIITDNKHIQDYVKFNYNKVYILFKPFFSYLPFTIKIKEKLQVLC